MVYAEALQLYRALDLDQPRIRLVGVKLENLRSAGEATQLALDLDGGDAEMPPGESPSRPTRAPRDPDAARATDQAIDALVARFGDAIVRPASLLSPAAVASAGGLNRAKSRPENSPVRHQITNHLNLPSNPET